MAFIIKNYYLLLIIVMLSAGNAACSAATEHQEIPSLYIEAAGNNQHEAQIKAHKYGMQKMVLMIADKMGLNSADIDHNIPYCELKKVFTVASITDQVSTNENYSARVSYSYNLCLSHKLLLNYGNAAINQKFYQYLILPIFKQRHVVSLWGNNHWHKKWTAARSRLDNHRLFYPQPSTALGRQITNQNVLGLSYQDFANILQNQLIKKVMLVTAEYFTDLGTGKSWLDVQSTILDYHQPNIATAQKYLISNPADIGQIIDSVITQIIKNYGKLPHASLKTTAQPFSLRESSGHGQQNIMLSVTVCSDQDLQDITKRLKSIKEISSLTVTNYQDNIYHINITSNNNEFALAEALYLNDFSYKKYGNIYSLIDAQEGL